MATPTIPNGEEHFFPIVYEGNGGGQKVGKFVPFTDSGTIANSCIFNDGDSAYLTRTPSSSGSATTFTISAWVKFGALGTSQELFGNAPSGSAASILTVLHYTDNTIYVQGFTNGGSYTMNLQTRRQYNDTSKWYHILIAFDTTQSTSTDRVKIYIDGTLQSLAQTTYPGQNENFGTNQSGIPCTIGRYNYDATRYFDGYMAEVNMVDGQALTPASFGVTDTSTGRWIPKTVSPYPTTTTDIAVTVVSSGGNKFAVDGVTQGAVTLIEGATYKFDQSDSSNATHPLRFSTTSDGTHNSGTEYTTGVTTAGTPGSSGAYTQITVATGAPTLYYYCSSHSGMGGTANTQDQYGTNGFRLKFLDSTHAGIDTSGNGNTFTASNLIDFESQPIAMGGTAFDTGSAGAWDGSYPVANGFTKNTSTQAIYNDGSTAVGGVIGWDFGSGRSANIQHIKINQIAVNNSITGFTFEYSDNGSDYTSVGTFSVTASASEQTVSVLNTAGKHRYWRLKSTTNTTGGQSSYRWIVAFLGFYSEPITTDSPTQNFVTFDEFDSGNTGTTGGAGTIVLANGNLRLTAGSNPSNWDIYRTSKPVTSGKYYAEVTLTDLDGATYFGCISKNQNIKNTTNLFYDFLYGWSYATDNGKIETNNSGQLTYGSARSEGDVIGIAIDMDNGNLWFSENGTYPNSGNPVTGANPAFTNLKIANQDGGLSFACQMGYSGAIDWNFGQRSYRHTPPTGFATLQQDNMPETSKGVSGLTWTKDRDAAVSWMCIDSSRIYSAENVPGAMNLNNTNREYGQVDFVDGINKFLKGGYALVTSNNTYSYMNKSGNSNVSYSWVANSGTTSSNTTGSITSTVQANTTAGFSIVQYVGTGSSGSVGHGLSAAPEFMIFKDRDNDSTNWRTFHTGFGNITTYQKLNSDDGYGTASMWGSPTASAFIIGGTGYEVNESSTNYVAYCWHGVDGFSKFGKYTGTGNADGTFIYTGFKPAFVMIKGYTIGTPWIIWDNKRSPFNPGDNVVYPNITDAEATSGNDIDILSNGFKARGTAQDYNGSYTYLYMAWAEHPFVGDGTNPVTAR